MLFFHGKKMSKKKLLSINLNQGQSFTYICKCNRVFAYRSKLAEHQKTCKLHKNFSQTQNGENVKGNTINECPKCKRVFIRRKNLFRHQILEGHMDKEELKNLKVECENCTKSFLSHTALDKHTRTGSCLQDT